MVNVFCGLRGCNRSHYARTLCHSHYDEWRNKQPAKPAAEPPPPFNWDRAVTGFRALLTEIYDERINTELH